MWIKKKDYEYFIVCARHNQSLLQRNSNLKEENDKLKETKKSKTENTKVKVDSFNEAAKPLMEWLEKNCNPHHVAIVDSMGAQLMSGEIGVPSPLAIKYREENNDLVK